MNKLIIAAAILSTQATAVLACDLKVESAWIREAPPNAAALAGYAKLSNTGATTLKIQAVSSLAFNAVELHESSTENGVAKMRPVVVEIPGKGVAQFAAGSKHFMLLGPKQPLKKGDVVTVKITDTTGCITAAPFKVSAASAPSAHDHSTMDHSKMNHSGM